MLTIPHAKEVKNNGKSDLQLIWECGASPASSPFSKKRSRPSDVVNILSLLSSPGKSPQKKLFVPPSLHPRTDVKKKDSGHDDSFFLVSCTSITTDKEFERPKPLCEIVTYVFKGPENQLDAWNDLKRKINDIRCCVVTAARFAFLFQNGEVTTKAFSGSAEKQLEEISPNGNINDIQADDVINLIDTIQQNEKLSLYSTDSFYYSVIYPINLKNSQFESSEGKRYRTVFSGFLFPFEVKALQDEENNYDVFKLSTNRKFQIWPLPSVSSEEDIKCIGTLLETEAFENGTIRSPEGVIIETDPIIKQEISYFKYFDNVLYVSYDWVHYYAGFNTTLQTLKERIHLEVEATENHENAFISGYGLGGNFVRYFLIPFVDEEWKSKYVEGAMFFIPGVGGTFSSAVYISTS